MRRLLLAMILGMPWPAIAVDLEAISRGLVEAGPWGRNADVLPMLLGWLGVVLLLAVLLKLIYMGFDTWRTQYHAREIARQHTDEWILEMGELLNVRAPRGLKPGGSTVGWHQYRHQVKLALLNELQRSRQMSAHLAELQRDEADGRGTGR